MIGRQTGDQSQLFSRAKIECTGTSDQPTGACRGSFRAQSGHRGMTVSLHLLTQGGLWPTQARVTGLLQADLQP
jgi:hypothetical protein